MKYEAVTNKGTRKAYFFIESVAEIGTNQVLALPPDCIVRGMIFREMKKSVGSAVFEI